MPIAIRLLFVLGCPVGFAGTIFYGNRILARMPRNSQMVMPMCFAMAFGMFAYFAVFMISLVTW